MILQALDDGEIIQDEIDLLETFRIHFGIDQITHRALLERARASPASSEHYGDVRRSRPNSDEGQRHHGR